ncbi:MAG: leishmanolysin-related zinc metalloendopeptidase, partial [Planctomycetaceae bacterium]
GPGPGPDSEYNLEVRFTDGTLSASQQAIFTTAASRWSEIITGDVPDAVVDGLTVDDLVIDASAPIIDGAGGILGQAGPTSLRNGSALPSRGIMEFDGADLDELESSGDLLNVILHEMGHVIGIGTIWGNLGLTQNAGDEIHFTGSQAIAEYQSIFNTSDNFVPVETDGGPGTAGGHWDEETFANELMTGFLDGGVTNPISRITVGALADMGYQVNLNAADPYSPPAPGSSRKTGEIVWGGSGHSHSHLSDFAATGDQTDFAIPIQSADDDPDELITVDPDVEMPVNTNHNCLTDSEDSDKQMAQADSSADEHDSTGDLEHVDEVLTGVGVLLDVI